MGSQSRGHPLQPRHPIPGLLSAPPQIRGLSQLPWKKQFCLTTSLLPPKRNQRSENKLRPGWRKASPWNRKEKLLWETRVRGKEEEEVVLAPANLPRFSPRNSEEGMI